MFGIKTHMRVVVANLRWRRKNPHNRTRLERLPVGLENVRVGRYSYGPIGILSATGDPHLAIGSFCPIAGEATFIEDNDHPTDRLSTFPFQIHVLRQRTRETMTKGGIVIGDDVWIGYRSTILDGVHIGQGAAIAANSVATRDVPAYAIVDGLTTRVLKDRFDRETVGRLQSTDFAGLDEHAFQDDPRTMYFALGDRKTAEDLINQYFVQQ